MRKILAATAVVLASFGFAKAAEAAEPVVELVAPAPEVLVVDLAAPAPEVLVVDLAAPAPEVLGNCSPAGPTRFSTYWAFSVVCRSGTGGVQSKLSILTASGAVVTDYGPCVGKYSGSPAYVYPPWYLGGMSGSRVYVANWRSC